MIWLLPLILYVVKGKQLWQIQAINDIDSIEFESEFISWKNKFNKQYIDDNTQNIHYKAWISNWKMINSFNLQNETNLYTLKMNQFSDLTTSQFHSLFINNYYNINHSKHIQKKASYLKREDIPTSIDWTNYNGTNYILPAKQLSNCPNSPLFPLNSISSRCVINNASLPLYQLSQQEIAQCIVGYCYGGMIEEIYQFDKQNNGVCTENDYDGTAGYCQKQKCKPVDAINGYVDVTKYNETALMEAISTGPVVVGVEANQIGFQFYNDGIFNGECGTQIDHLLLAVGYGSDQHGNGYWKCQNNWGTSWGEDGYILICKDCDKNGDAGQCGILTMSSFPTVSNLSFNNPIHLKYHQH